jgi:hypothetical protein
MVAMASIVPASTANGRRGSAVEYLEQKIANLDFWSGIGSSGTSDKMASPQT